MAKENKPAEAYAKNGNNVATMKDAIVKKGNAMDELKISVAGISKSQMDEVKTSGVKTRGNGCATKGTMARGPLA